MVAWITGAGRNIGRAVCLRLAADGLDVVAIGHTRPATVEAVADEARALGVDALALTPDMSDPGAVTRTAAAALSCFGRVDLLVKSVGTRQTKTPAVLDHPGHAGLAPAERAAQVDIEGPLPLRLRELRERDGLRAG
jgi:NAD(P)-dependent dehydrogenase (short-subunit alcohol dehydrogenase family)